MTPNQQDMDLPRVWLREDGVYKPLRRSQTVWQTISSKPGEFPSPEDYKKFEENPPRDIDGEIADYSIHEERGLAAVTQTDLPHQGCALPCGYYALDTDSESTPRLVVVATSEVAAIHLGTPQTTVDDDVNRFLANRALYDSIGIAYRRGVLLYGPPGDGKTTLIRQLCQRVLRESWAVAIESSNSLPPARMIELLKKDPRLKIFVFEELTHITAVDHRLANLLSLLDGSSSLDNYLALATTNYPGELPSNVVERPSRFDLVLEVGAPEPAVRRELGIAFLGRPMTEVELEETEGMSVASIKEACLLSRLKGTEVVNEKAAILERQDRAKKDFGEAKRDVGFSRRRFSRATFRDDEDDF